MVGSSFGPVRFVAAVIAAALLAACGGGGSSSAPKPTPTPAPTLNPNCKQLSPQGGITSVYTLKSDPTGVQVTRVNAADTTCSYFTGVTNTTDQPQTAPNQWLYEFGSPSNNPYKVAISQTNNGPHTLYYNASGDSSGSVNVSSLQTTQRATQTISRGADEVHRGIQSFSGQGVVPTKVLVRYRGGAATGRSAAARVESAEGSTGYEVPAPNGIYQRIVEVPAGTDVTTFANKLRAMSEVENVYPVHKRFALGKPATPVSDPHILNNTTDQWYLIADGFPNAWTYIVPNFGLNAKIAIIDTGYDTQNADLNTKVDYAFGYHTTGNTAQDTNGHGTNVSGVAGAMTNNAVGFAGAGYNVRLLEYNIFPDATATSDKQNADVADEATAIRDAVTNRGADVINLSLGAGQGYGTSDGYDQTEHDAVEFAISQGVTVVAAAGNNADGGEAQPANTSLDYPAAYDGVIAVGASALKNDNGAFSGATEYVAAYSQYGPTLGLVAPGGDPASGDTNPLHWIWNYSTSTANFPTDQCKTPSPPTSCTAFFAGTSQATPQVSAAAALLIASAGGHRALTPARVAQLLEGTADNINDPHQGHGRLNIYRAMAALNNDTGAYSGPTPQKAGAAQLVAFAYKNSGGTTPQILDSNYPGGVPVDSSGNFRIADVLVGAGTYKIGVWYDANGDGVIDAGDQFGASTATCNASSKCTIGTVTLQSVGTNFTLP